MAFAPALDGRALLAYNLVIFVGVAARKAFDWRVKLGVWSAESYPPPPYYYPQGIETPERMMNLTEGLLRRGFAEADVRKVLGLNWMRVYAAVWGD